MAGRRDGWMEALWIRIVLGGRRLARRGSVPFEYNRLRTLVSTNSVFTRCYYTP